MGKIQVQIRVETYQVHPDTTVGGGGSGEAIGGGIGAVFGIANEDEADDELRTGIVLDFFAACSLTKRLTGLSAGRRI